MRARTYLLTALLAFVASVSGSMILASILLAGSDPGTALADHLDWVLRMPLGVVFLFIPFAGTGLICAALSKRHRAAAIFVHAVAIMALAVLYSNAFQEMGDGPARIPRITQGLPSSTFLQQDP
jgi:hypothetical protein